MTTQIRRDPRDGVKPSFDANQGDVDAVITWVDGSDPTHVIRRQESMKQASYHRTLPIAAGKDPTRFKNNGELMYCLASIRKFAPWIRKIHLVTDGQIPEFLTPDVQRSYKISIVDHRDIFCSYEWALPTFNSRTIETALWRIPTLSTRFLYFNDDIVLLKPTGITDFFTHEGVLLRGNWRKLVELGNARLRLNQVVNYAAKKFFGVTRTMYLYAQMEGARRAGFKKHYFRHSHVPHPLRVDTLSEFFTTQPKLFNDNIQYKFRDAAQFLTVSLSNHLEILKNEAKLTKELSLITISAERQPSKYIRRIISNLEHCPERFLCLSSIEKLPTNDFRKLDSVLNSIVN